MSFLSQKFNEPSHALYYCIQSGGRVAALAAMLARAIKNGDGKDVRERTREYFPSRTSYMSKWDVMRGNMRTFLASADSSEALLQEGIAGELGIALTIPDLSKEYPPCIHPIYQTKFTPSIPYSLNLRAPPRSTTLSARLRKSLAVRPATRGTRYLATSSP